MWRNKFTGGTIGIPAITALTLILASGAAASQFKVLHPFTYAASPTDLVFDAAGNLYGTTQEGGYGSAGIVYKLAPNPNGSWTLSLLYYFKGGTTDGAHPSGRVTFDAAGNLYGTAEDGGSNGCNYGCGMVYKLSPNPDGTWTKSVLYNFSGTDGGNPLGGVIFDAAGNLYGTAQSGGLSGACYPARCGIVFKLKPNPDGTWTESVLYTFTGGADGADPEAGLTFDAAGNLYGTTYWGGSSTACGSIGCGLVFKLKPNSDGTWTESVLHSFSRTDGGNPLGGVAFDAAGNLYGTTTGGSSTKCYGGCGVVWKLAPNPDGTWTKSVLHSFSGSDGEYSSGELTFDAAGNLYGTTFAGGACKDGVVFKLSPNPDGTWTETVLHNFIGYGSSPFTGVIRDAAGNLYGTTRNGSNNGGLVFEITP